MLRDRPNDDRHRPEAGDREQHLDADVLLERVPGVPKRDQRRADRGRGAQQAEPLGADLQDVAREDRQHRGRPAEQHREQVERDRAEQEAVAGGHRSARRPSGGSGWAWPAIGGGTTRRIGVSASIATSISAGGAPNRAWPGRRRRGSRRAPGRRPRPTCQAIELIAIALGKILGGTMLGAIAAIAGPTNTRATPCSAAKANRIGRVRASVAVSQPSARATVMSMPLASRATVRRSNRSATQPATGVSRPAARTGPGRAGRAGARPRGSTCRSRPRATS